MSFSLKRYNHPLEDSKIFSKLTDNNTTTTLKEENTHGMQPIRIPMDFNYLNFFGSGKKIPLI
jgi:hypothetical protein